MTRFTNPAAALCFAVGVIIITLTIATAAVHGGVIGVIYAIEWGADASAWFLSLSPWRQYALAFGVGVVLVCSGVLMQRLHDRWLQ